jgi:hypothetical protein
MPPTSKPAAESRSAGRAASSDHPSVLALTLAGWLVPGAAHAMVGQFRKAIVLFAILVVMFAFGIASGGRLFPFVPSDPLLFLAALAEWALGLPRIVAALAGYGQGDVIAVAYEYGNTFLIAAGLLNTLVVLDACDVATGRKRT